MAQYASKYYDPVKAHEYYMKNRELKGYEDRYGGSRGDGTSAASSGYTSSNQSSNQSSINYNEKIYETKTDSSGKILEINAKIQNLRNKLNSMSKEDKANNRDNVQEAIDGLRKQITAIRRETQDKTDILKDQQHYQKLAEKDAAQEAKMRQKTGTTAGFNEKGKAAAAYIKDQMNKERDEVIKKTNKDLDNQMLGEAQKLADSIVKARQSGKSIDNKTLLQKLRGLTSKTKTKKANIKKQHINNYKQKYKDEINKLRLDKSMYTYYDKRAVSEEKYIRDKENKERMKQFNRALQDSATKVKDATKQRARAERALKRILKSQLSEDNSDGVQQISGEYFKRSFRISTDDSDSPDSYNGSARKSNTFKKTLTKIR